MDFAKETIGLKLIDSNRTTNNIWERILSVVTKYMIRNDIISITLDNATVNTKEIGELEGLISSNTGGSLQHQCYGCHIINLIVKSGMKVIDEYIHKI